MPKLIKDGAVFEDNWQWLELPEDETPLTIPEGDVILPLPVWLEQKSQLADRQGETAVWLHGHEDPAQLAEHIDDTALIAVHFPVFTDGRGFSTGRLLRERYGFTGDLRAAGDFLRDQLCYLRRCGFTSFALPERFDPEAALASLNDFTEYYQGAVDQPEPLFRRRQSHAYV